MSVVPPMALWQLDIVGGAFLADGTKAKIVTGVDDHSPVLRERLGGRPRDGAGGVPVVRRRAAAVRGTGRGLDE
jgi:hypothetical protein